MQSFSIRTTIAMVWAIGLTLGNAVALFFHHMRQMQWHYWSLDGMGFFNGMLIIVGVLLVATAPSTKPRPSNH